MLSKEACPTAALLVPIVLAYKRIISHSSIMRACSITWPMHVYTNCSVT